MTAWPMVVPFESRSQIVCDPDVVSRWINVAAEDVDNAFLDAVHVVTKTQAVGPAGISNKLADWMRDTR